MRSRSMARRSHGSSLQKAHRDVEGRAAPAFHREQLRQQAARSTGAMAACRVVRMRVASSDWCASRMRRVGEQHALLGEHPLRELLGPERLELLLRAGRRRLGGGTRGGRGALRRAGRARLRVSGWPLTIVSPMKFSRRVARSRRRGELEQLGRLVDEPGRVVAAREARVHDDLVEEAQVRHHAADAELPQRAVHARDGLLRRGRPRRHLHQQRIVRARDDRAGVRRARIEAHAEAGGTAVGGDACRSPE